MLVGAVPPTVVSKVSSFMVACMCARALDVIRSANAWDSAVVMLVGALNDWRRRNENVSQTRNFNASTSQIWSELYLNLPILTRFGYFQRFLNAVFIQNLDTSMQCTSIVTSRCSIEHVTIMLVAAKNHVKNPSEFLTKFLSRRLSVLLLSLGELRLGSDPWSIQWSPISIKTRKRIRMLAYSFLKLSCSSRL